MAGGPPATIWKVANRGGEAHNFHVHGDQFRVLSVGRAQSSPEQTG